MMDFKRRRQQRQAHVSRRKFLQLTGATGVGLVIGVQLQPPAAVARQAGTTDLAYNAFVSVSPDNTVKVLIKHLEMGQGVYTGLATCVAEEMDASWEQIVCEHAPVDTEKYANLGMGLQATGGSTGMANSYEQMRQAGAMARAVLVAAAAERWNVPATAISVADGTVRHGPHVATFGELAVDAARQPVPDLDSLNLKSPDSFTFIGNPALTRKDVGKHDGSAIYTQDIQLPGMLTAVVAHSPRFGGRVSSFDATAALAINGVEAVLQIDSGIAVLARDYWTATRGRDALSIQWDDSNAEMRGSRELLAQYRALLETPGVVAEQTGDAEATLSAAGNTLEASFEYPYLSHAPMEPMNCVARVDGTSAELWYGCQFQTIDQQVVAELIGGQPEDVEIHTLLAGGGFGRRANPFSDYIVETVNIARQLPGRPIKLVWSREDDIQGGYYRPAFVHRLSASLGADGKPEAFKARLVGQSIMAGTPLADMSITEGVDFSSVEGLVDLAYQVPHRQVELHSPEVGIPVQWWRSVGNTHTAFSKEVFIDLLAREAGVDPVAYRLSLLQHNPKESAVLRMAADKAGWGSTAVPADTGRGVAVHSSFGSSVAEIVDVSRDGDSFRVDRVVAVIDCGTVVNPDIVKAQVEGAIALGLSTALGDELTLTDGLVDQSNFHDYQVLRMNAMPEVEVYFIESDLPPTGVGEPGTPPIAPAVANALAALTGQTFTRLPLRLDQAV